MDVSVIMINYNTFDLTKDALDSIFARTQGLAYEIILVDNLSPDGSGEKLRDLFGDKIVYLQSGGNLGTSKAFNLGLKHATGKYILWLNTDILIKENFIKKLFDYMESDPKCGVCGGNLLDFRGRPVDSFRRAFENVGTMRRRYSIFINLLLKFPHRRFGYNYSNKPRRVAWVGGADMMVRRSIFDQIGGLDEVIFMYAEEMEFQYRVTKFTDYTIMSVPWAHMYHLENGSIMPKRKIFNEKWERLILLGFPRYLYKWFKTEDVKKYLEVKIRGTRKLYFIYKVLGDPQRADRCKKLILLFREYLNNFDWYLLQLQGNGEQSILHEEEGRSTT